MLGAVNYPITVVEFVSYSEDADHSFNDDEHQRLKDYLAFTPDAGDPIAGAGGVRQLLWPYEDNDLKREAQIIYFFRDLNMPLYLLAVFIDGDRVDFDDEWRNEMARLAAELIEEHSKKWPRRGAMPDNLA